MSGKYASARDVLSDWNAKVNAGNRDSVLALYSDDAVLLPTFSGETRATRIAIGDYFDCLIDFEEVTVVFDEDSMEYQQITPSIHCLSGKYTWDWIRDGKHRHCSARFSYIVDLENPAPIL
ncbi:MAG: DUF4440 domain-containing protein, partial [Puniceicoccaceae bacterium]